MYLLTTVFYDLGQVEIAGRFSQWLVDYMNNAYFKICSHPRACMRKFRYTGRPFHQGPKVKTVHIRLRCMLLTTAPRIVDFVSEPLYK